MSWFLPFDLEPSDYPPISTSPSPVKIEQDDPDSPFIMELAAYPPQSSPSSTSSPDYNDSHPSAPPTEVPLRATQASKEMRGMMGVFRLNPFAMHSLSRGADSDDSPDGSPTGSVSWCGEPGPLEQEPIMFEFQLDISALDREDHRVPALHPVEPSSRIPAISAHDEFQLRSFSPSFELHEGDLSESLEPAPSNNKYIHHHVNHQQVVSDKDPGSDFRHRPCDPWEEADYAPQTGSDSGASSSTTVSVQTSLTAGSSECAEQTSPTAEFSSTSLWDVPDNYQIQDGPGAGSSANYAHPDPSHRGGTVHPNTSHPYLRMTYSTAYNRQPYAQPNTQFQQLQGQSNFFGVPTNHSPSLLHNSRRQESSSSQEMELVPQSPSTLSPLSPPTPNSLQYAFNQQHGHYQSQHPSPSHQIPVYNNVSSPVTPTSMPLLLPISIARSAMRSAVAYSNAGSPTSCPSQPPSPSLYNMQTSGRGYRVSRGPHLEERINEHEVYSTPHSPVTGENGDRYVPSTSLSMGMPISMHPVLQRSSTYVGVHPVPQGVPVVSSGHPNTNNRRWSLPEMSTAVGPTESFLGHVLGS